MKSQTPSRDFLYQLLSEISDFNSPFFEFPPTTPPNVRIGVEYSDNDFANIPVEQSKAARRLVAAKSARFQCRVHDGSRHDVLPDAEQEALVGIREDVVAGAVVYSTLEPCTLRGNQTPCCLRLLDRNVSEVVIGILDPNPDIRGRGWWKFEERGIKVRNFTQQLVREIREMNQTFIDEQLGPGLMITAIQPEGANELRVSEHHRARREAREVKQGRVSWPAHIEFDRLAVKASPSSRAVSPHVLSASAYRFRL